VKVYPLSSDDCKRFWGETLKSILPDKYYDGPGLLKPYPWAATTEVTVTVDPQNTEDSGEGNSNGEGSSTGEGSSNGNKSFADVWRCCDEKKIKLPVNQSEQGWNEVEEEVTYEGKGKAKLVEVVESWMSADVFDELTPTTLSPSDSLESEA
jgi:hypothetical protein